MVDDDAGPGFLADGGEMGELMRAYDWARTSMGPPAQWPQSLRTTIRLMLNSRHPMFIWWGPDLIQFYNDAYRETMGPEMHPAALGARGRESWADIWPIIGPQVEFVMAGKGSTWNVEQLVPIRRHGAQRDVWWTYGYSPIDLDDGVGGVLVVCTDVTETHLLTASLEDESRRLRQQFEQAPGFIAVLRGPEHIFDLTNAAYRQLIGGREVIDKPVREALPEVAGQGFFELLDQVYESGVAHVGRRTPITLQSDASKPARRLFLDFVYQPVIDGGGQVSGIFVEGQDVTDHVAAEEQLQLLIGELKHRIKNTLATVGAVASQTLSGAGAAPMRIFHDRLAAFAAAHDALSAVAEPTAQIESVINRALAPHRERGDRLWISGPSLTIGSRQSLALALAVHELATNAVKYGSLSVPEGRVELDWQANSAGTFELRWSEKGGPPVARPSRKGFGSRLIQRVLTAEFGGEVVAHYAPGGLVVTLSSPSEGLR